MYSFGYLRKQKFSKVFKNIRKKKLGGLVNCESTRDPNNMLTSYTGFIF